MKQIQIGQKFWNAFFVQRHPEKIARISSYVHFMLMPRIFERLDNQILICNVSLFCVLIWKSSLYKKSLCPRFEEEEQIVRWMDGFLKKKLLGGEETSSNDVRPTLKRHKWFSKTFFFSWIFLAQQHFIHLPLDSRKKPDKDRVFCAVLSYSEGHFKSPNGSEFKFDMWLDFFSTFLFG